MNVSHRNAALSQGFQLIKTKIQFEKLALRLCLRVPYVNIHCENGKKA